MSELSDEQYQSIMDTADEITEQIFEVLNDQESNPGIAVMIALARTLHQTGLLVEMPNEAVLEQFGHIYTKVASAHETMLEARENQKH